jgi:hypothetical protein
VIRLTKQNRPSGRFLFSHVEIDLVALACYNHSTDTIEMEAPLKKLVMPLALVAALAVIVVQGIALNARPAPSKEQVETVRRYEMLPASTRNSLLEKDLEGVSYFVSVDKELGNAVGKVDYVTATITSFMLGHGGHRASSRESAQLRFRLGEPIGTHIFYSGAKVELTDSNGNVLLVGCYNNEILWNHLGIIKDSLGTEKKNQLLRIASK